MRPIRTLLIVLAVTALDAVAGGGADATTGTGLHGLVTRGPISPVCVAEQPCDGPAPGVTLVFRHAGDEVARARTGSAGGYRVTLPAGWYTVKPLSGRHMQPSAAHVVTGRFRRVDFSIDTGIR
jgi:hypothetical protein